MGARDRPTERGGAVGSNDDLDATLDDEATPREPIRVRPPRRTPPPFATVEETPVEHLIERVESAAHRIEEATAANVIREAAKTAEAAMLHDSTWARGVDADIAAIKAAIAKPARRRLLGLVAKYATGTAIAGALAWAVHALITYGNGQEVGRAQSEAVRRHSDEIHDLQLRQAADDEAHGRRNRP